jgi:predicted GNAT superfamily acetyltransferase
MKERAINIVKIILISLISHLFLSPVVYSQSDQVERLIQNLNSEYRDLRMSAVWTLRKVKDSRALEALIAALNNKDSNVREKAAEALGEIKDPRAIEPLISALIDQEEMIREAAAKALGDITGKDFGQDYDKWKKWWESISSP